MNTDSHDPLPEPPGDDVLAGEYVLGVLDAATRAAVAARLPREPALAREVAAWEQRLAAMLDDIEPVVPPLGLWARVRARVGASAPTRADATATPLWRRLGFWRGFSAAALAATAASLVALVVMRGASPPSPLPPHPITLVTTLAHADGSPAFMAAVDADACTMLVMPMSDAGVPAGKVPELWVIGGDGTPRSLGVRGSRRSQAIAVPAQLRGGLKPASTLAVSIEPRGGSPTGAPTGAVIAQGALVAL